MITADLVIAAKMRVKEACIRQQSMFGFYRRLKHKGFARFTFFVDLVPNLWDLWEIAEIIFRSIFYYLTLVVARLSTAWLGSLLHFQTFSHARRTIHSRPQKSLFKSC